MHKQLRNKSRSKTKNYLKCFPFFVKTRMSTNSTIFLDKRAPFLFVRRQVYVSVASWAAMQNNVVTTSRSLGLGVELVEACFDGSGRCKFSISSDKFVTHEV